jgi:hypothetical protein
LHSRALSVAIPKRNALTAKEITSHSVVGEQRRKKPPERHRRGGEENHQD